MPRKKVITVAVLAVFREIQTGVRSLIGCRGVEI
jgi:hypothetical protein